MPPVSSTSSSKPSTGAQHDCSSESSSSSLEQDYSTSIGENKVSSNHRIEVVPADSSKPIIDKVLPLCLNDPHSFASYNENGGDILVNFARFAINEWGLPKEDFTSILEGQPKKVIDLTSDKEEISPKKKIPNFDEDLVCDPLEENLSNALLVSAVLEEEGLSMNLSDMMRYGVVSETSVLQTGKGKTVFVFNGESKKSL